MAAMKRPENPNKSNKHTKTPTGQESSLLCIAAFFPLLIFNSKTSTQRKCGIHLSFEPDRLHFGKVICRLLMVNLEVGFFFFLRIHLKKQNKQTRNRKVFVRERQCVATLRALRSLEFPCVSFAVVFKKSAYPKCEVHAFKNDVTLILITG